VAASGANPRSITYHFGSKERLMAEALGEAFRRRSVPMMEASAARGETAEASFAGTFAGLLAAVHADRELAFALTDAISQARAEDVRAALAEHYELMRAQGTALVEATLGEALAEAGGDARTLSSTLLALFDGLVLQGLVDPEGPPEADAVLTSLRAALRVG
jgi:AcrR family transcriptional regulator